MGTLESSLSMHGRLQESYGEDPKWPNPWASVGFLKTNSCSEFKLSDLANPEGIVIRFGHLYLSTLVFTSLFTTGIMLLEITRNLSLSTDGDLLSFNSKTCHLVTKRVCRILYYLLS